MTNDEIRINDEARRTKPPTSPLRSFGHSGFGFLSSFVIRHSSFNEVLLLAFTILARRLEADSAWEDLVPFFKPPSEYSDNFGAYRSPLKFEDGRPVKNAGDWARRRHGKPGWEPSPLRFPVRGQRLSGHAALAGPPGRRHDRPRRLNDEYRDGGLALA